jgi:hypothetical protein
MHTPPTNLPPALVDQAANWIRSADALVIAAGAGMGVDSGLPDFRGDEGFWNAYPPFRHLGLKFTNLANSGHAPTRLCRRLTAPAACTFF